MDGPLAFGADFSVDSATHPANGLTESLQSIARTPVDRVCLESPVLVVSAPAWLVVALSSSVPLRRGGQAGPAQRLLPCVPPALRSSHVLRGTFALLRFGGGWRAPRFSGPPGFSATPR